MRDFVMDKSGAGAGFLLELRFPLPIYIPSASPQSSSLSPEAGTIGQEWPQWQQSHKIKWRWGTFSPSTSVSPANFHSTNFFAITITYHPGLVQ
jgi:hypothetical protein